MVMRLPSVSARRRGSASAHGGGRRVCGVASTLVSPESFGHSPEVQGVLARHDLVHGDPLPIWQISSGAVLDEGPEVF
jgi:hypothetical protein